MEPAAGGGAGRAEGHGLRAQTDDDAGGEVPQEDEGLAQLLAHAHLRLGVNRVRPRFAVVGCAGSGTWNSTVSLANLEAASPRGLPSPAAYHHRDLRSLEFKVLAGPQWFLPPASARHRTMTLPGLFCGLLMIK